MLDVAAAAGLGKSSLMSWAPWVPGVGDLALKGLDVICGSTAGPYVLDVPGPGWWVLLWH